LTKLFVLIDGNYKPIPGSSKEDDKWFPYFFQEVPGLPKDVAFAVPEDKVNSIPLIPEIPINGGSMDNVTAIGNHFSNRHMIDFVTEFDHSPEKHIQARRGENFVLFFVSGLPSETNSNEQYIGASVGPEDGAENSAGDNVASEGMVVSLENDTSQQDYFMQNPPILSYKAAYAMLGLPPDVAQQIRYAKQQQEIENARRELYASWNGTYVY
jgi:hypothetical protein